MPEVVIRNRRIEQNAWTFVGVISADGLSQPLPAGPVALPLAAWKQRRVELALRKEPLGVWLAPDDDPREIAADLAVLALVAVRFPKFTDGRGYSMAYMLRRRFGYRGELRAFGDVGRDQLFYLSRVGFDSFRLADHRDAADALASFNDFTVRYQGSIDNPTPLFRRREMTYQ